MQEYVKECMASYVESLLRGIKHYNPQPNSLCRLGTRALLDLTEGEGGWVPAERIKSQNGTSGTGLQPWINAGIVEKKEGMRRIRPEFYSAMKEAIEEHGL